MGRGSTLLGKKLLIVGGGSVACKSFVYEHLHSIGVQLTLLGHAPREKWDTLLEAAVFDQYIRVPVSATEETEEAYIRRCIAAIGDRAHEFDGVCTFSDEDVITMANIARALRLNLNVVRAYELARNKFLTRQAMAQAGLPTPRYSKISISQANGVESACEEVGFPAIMKPAYSSSSFAVMRVEDADEAKICYGKIRKLMQTDDYSSQSRVVLMEEYLDGDEVDVDIVLQDGSVVYAEISDNWQCEHNNYAETGTNCPSIHPIDKKRELIDLSVKATLALGFQNGVFHTEAKYTSGGPRIVEINARMGGHAVRDANLAAWGIDLIEETAYISCNIPSSFKMPSLPLKYLAKYAFTAPYSGTVDSDIWLDDAAAADPRVKKVQYFYRKGQECHGPRDGFPSRLAEFIVISDISVIDACQIAKNIVLKHLKPPITAKFPGNEKGFFFPSNGHPFDKIITL